MRASYLAALTSSPGAGNCPEASGGRGPDSAGAPRLPAARWTLRAGPPGDGERQAEAGEPLGAGPSLRSELPQGPRRPGSWRTTCRRGRRCGAGAATSGPTVRHRPLPAAASMPSGPPGRAGTAGVREALTGPACPSSGPQATGRRQAPEEPALAPRDNAAAEQPAPECLSGRPARRGTPPPPPDERPGRRAEILIGLLRLEQQRWSPTR